MQALGLIETKGLLAAIESADAMLKAAEVRLLERTFVGGGLVTITVTGDVAAVKAAIESGAAAVSRIDSTLLVSEHVIPRPHQELGDTILSATPLSEKREADPMPEDEPEVQPEPEEEMETETTAIFSEDDLAKLEKATIDKLAAEHGAGEAIAILNQLKVVELRNLAREYEGFGIAGRMISKANKQSLLKEFENYYK